MRFCTSWLLFIPGNPTLLNMSLRNPLFFKKIILVYFYPPWFSLGLQGRWEKKLNFRFSLRFHWKLQVLLPLLLALVKNTVLAPKKACHGGDQDWWAGKAETCCACTLQHSWNTPIYFFVSALNLTDLLKICWLPSLSSFILDIQELRDGPIFATAWWCPCVTVRNQ